MLFASLISSWGRRCLDLVSLCRGRKTGREGLVSRVKASRMFVKSFINGLKLIEIRQIESWIWKRAWQPSPVFLPGRSQEQRSLAGYSPWGCKESDRTEDSPAQHSHRFLACQGTSSSRPAGGAVQPWPCTPAEQGTSPGRACPISWRELVVYSFAPSGLFCAQRR